MNVTVGIPTRSRYEVLSHCLLSIAFQSLRPSEIIIVDDSDNPTDIRTIEHYVYLLKLFDEYGINWRVIWGAKRGQHWSHQLIQDEAKNDLVWRIDDDEIAEPNCLKLLYESMKDNVGAVAPIVLLPFADSLPNDISTNSIRDMYKPNMQWFKWNGIKSVDHLYSTYLYRKGISKFDLSLSPKAFREETIHTYGIKKAGYDLLINADAIVRHFQSGHGGIRV